MNPHEITLRDFLEVRVILGANDAPVPRAIRWALAELDRLKAERQAAQLDALAVRQRYGARMARLAAISRDLENEVHGI